jgi:sugar phosphate isomerase/epimerase
MKSAITVSLVPQAKGGPFVFWDGLDAAFQSAQTLGFDAVEIFPPAAEALEPAQIRGLMDKHHLAVAAVGTGGGWVAHQWHLCHPDTAVRSQSRSFIRAIIRRAGELGAPAILGSMQGRVLPGIEREQALEWLREALAEFDAEASQAGQVFLYEPLNRYETNLFNRSPDAATFLDAAGLPNTRILTDLFHMNIEEASIPDALKASAHRLGHVHFADSNRQAVGFGHTQMPPILDALRSVNYSGFLSAEILPLPDSETAARQTLAAFRALVNPR